MLALLFLEVMNWHDGIVIDRIGVGYSKFWIISGTEDIQYIQMCKSSFKRTSEKNSIKCFRMNHGKSPIIV